MSDTINSGNGNGNDTGQWLRELLGQRPEGGRGLLGAVEELREHAQAIREHVERSDPSEIAAVAARVATSEVLRVLQQRADEQRLAAVAADPSASVTVAPTGRALAGLAGAVVGSAVAAAASYFAAHAGSP